MRAVADIERYEAFQDSQGRGETQKAFGQAF